MTMPVRYLRAYLKMLPRVEAEHDMRLATAVGAGSGTLKDGAAVWENWRAKAGVTKAQTVRKVSAREAAGMFSGVKRG